MKNPSVIILQGRGNTGKTQTLMLLLDKLKLLGAQIIMEQRPNSSECYAILEFKKKVIALTTQGDSETDLQAWLTFAQKSATKIDLYICPCRTSGSSVRFIESAFQNNPNLFFGKWYVAVRNNANAYEDLQCRANCIQAEGLMEVIKALLRFDSSDSYSDSAF